MSLPAAGVATRWLDQCERLSTTRQVWLLVGLSFLLLVLAMPVPLMRGMLYAEEGTTYLRYAREATALRAFLAPHQGYFSLLPNSLALIATRLLPVRYMPLLFAWGALCVHLLVVWAAATCERFTSFRTRAVAAGVALLAAGTARTLESTINSQYFFGVAAVLVLLSSPARHRVARSLLLAMGSLTGLYVCFMAPAFLWKAIARRTLAAWWQALLVGALTLVQLVTVLHAIPYSTRSLPQQNLTVYIGSLFTNEVLLSFGSRILYRPLTLFIVRSGSALMYAVVALLAILAWGFLFRLVRKPGRLPVLLLCLALYLAACASIGIMGGPADVLGDGDRYHVVSNACLALAVLLAALRLPAGSRRLRICRVLVCLVLFSGFFDLARQWRSNSYDPAWAPQVLAWQANPELPLTTAPLHWKEHKVLLAPKPLKMEIPFYLYDSNLRASVRERIPADCFATHMETLAPGHCTPR